MEYFPLGISMFKFSIEVNFSPVELDRFALFDNYSANIYAGV